MVSATGQRVGYPRRTGACSAVTAAKNKKGPPSGDPFLFLVEAAELNPRPQALCHRLYMLSHVNYL